MSKKKKIDLSTELADLIMGDDSESEVNQNTSAQSSTRVLKDGADPDPTLAISKSPKHVESVAEEKSDDRGIDINVEKSVHGYNLERGVGAREESIESPKTEKKTLPVPEVKDQDVTQDIRVSESKKDEEDFGSSEAQELNRIFEQDVGAVEKKKSKKQSSDIALTAEASLLQSEQLRIAQDRILDLEKQVEDLRFENEELVTAAETLRTRNDSLKAQIEKTAHEMKEVSHIHTEEVTVLKANLSSKNDEIITLRAKVEEFESRLSGDLKKVRVRERELENRLEIAKLETHAILKNKDEVILDLKRRIDQLSYESENYRSKSKELNRVMEDNRERVRRTVKALRLALSMLEGEDEEVPLKKAE